MLCCESNSRSKNFNKKNSNLRYWEDPIEPGSLVTKPLLDVLDGQNEIPHQSG